MLDLRLGQEITLVSGNVGDKKSLHLGVFTHPFSLKNKESTFCCLKREKVNPYKQIRKWKTTLTANSDVSR